MEVTHVVVIDALDECEDEEAVPELISALAQPSASALPLKFVVISEQDKTIKRAFEVTLTTEKDYTSFHLQDIDKDVVSCDIQHYISESLTCMKRGRSEFKGSDENWPPLDQVGELTRRADR